MSTRGIYGIRKGKEDKITYNHSDSYPDCLGYTMAEFCATTSIDELNNIYERIELVDENTKPTTEQVKACAEYTNTSVSTGSTDDWYCLLRELQGHPEKWKKIDGTIYMIDDAEFIKNSLFCEYGYIINLDTECLEFWIGWQKVPWDENRYGTERNDSGYYPCWMIKEYPLKDITPDNVSEIVEDMKKVES